MKFSPKRPGLFKISQDKIQHPQAWNSGNLAREFLAFTGIKSQYIFKLLVSKAINSKLRDLGHIY